MFRFLQLGLVSERNVQREASPSKVREIDNYQTLPFHGQTVRPSENIIPHKLTFAELVVNSFRFLPGNGRYN